MLCKLHIKKFQQPRVELKTGHHCSSRPPLLHFPFPWEAEEEGRDTRTPTPSPTTPCRRAARPWGSTRSSSSSSSGSPPPQPPPGRRSTPSASRRKVPSCSFSPPRICLYLSFLVLDAVLDLVPVGAGVAGCTALQTRRTSGAAWSGAGTDRGGSPGTSSTTTSATAPTAPTSQVASLLSPEKDYPFFFA